MFSPKAADEIVDLIECVVIAHSDNALGFQQIRAIVDRHSTVSETEFNWALTKMQRRYKLLAGNYPFSFEGSSIRKQADWKNSTYLLLLGLCSSSPLADSRYGKFHINGEVAFELVSEAAIRNWLGTGSESVRFGWPSQVGRPPEFPQAIKWLSEKLGVQLGTAYLPPIRKDGGVDVVVWRHFPDKRSGFQILLVQCTLQEDLVSKSKDIDIRNWSSWLTLDSDPLTIVSSPRLVGEGSDKWNQVSRRSIIFDRIRISGFLGSYESCDSSSEISDNLSSQCVALRESLEI